MAGNKIKVHIYDADQDFRVHPPLAEADGDFTGGNPDQVVFRNHTAEELVLYAQAGVFAVGAIADPIPVGGKVTKTAKTSGAANTVRLIPYVIFGSKSGKKAKGNSDPVIIIEN